MSGSPGPGVPKHLNRLSDVSNAGYCIGCGACAYADPASVELVNIENLGIRPRFTGSGPEAGGGGGDLTYCPGAHLDGELVSKRPPATHAEHEFGVALEIWEGHATDPEIRWNASSGGLLTALSLHCLEAEGMGGVLHTGADKSHPWRNRTVMSHTREELLSRTGSRYAPSSPCEGLGQVETSETPCVFVGKPCDTAATMALRQTRPELDRKLGLVLTFFCAGTPSNRGTLDLMSNMGFASSEATSVRYRGQGWPGLFTVQAPGKEPGTMTYDQSWGRLTGYRPLRCNLCPDGVGRLADIACGDAWNRFDKTKDDPGQSLVLVRTERGRQILRRAIERGVVQLRRVDEQAMFDAQPNLLQRRRDIQGRLLALRAVGLPVPKFDGFSLQYSWRQAGFKNKAKTVIGTMRRAIQRDWWRRPEATRRGTAAS